MEPFWLGRGWDWRTGRAGKPASQVCYVTVCYVTESSAVVPFWMSIRNCRTAPSACGAGRGFPGSAAAIRAVYDQEGELSAAIELRRLFPGITDNAKARAHARTIAEWQPLSKPVGGDQAEAKARTPGERRTLIDSVDSDSLDDPSLPTLGGILVYRRKIEMLPRAQSRDTSEQRTLM
jgi:hypothetical protein